ncbi:MAG: DMT family transporter, partial [Paracoccaceae bacterium]
MPHSKIGAPHMRSDNFMGICFMALGMFLFSAVDTMAKFLSDGMHPVQIVWFRQLGLLCGVVVFLLLRGPAFLISKQPLLQVMRGVTAAGSACLFVMALRYVPLADAAAVSFVAPFIVIVLGVSVLKEKVGLRRWISVILGFVGTLVVIRPG